MLHPLHRTAQTAARQLTGSRPSAKHGKLGRPSSIPDWVWAELLQVGVGW